MNDFNNMTVSAACRLLENPHTVATLDSLLVEWNLFDDVGSGSKPAKLAALARIAVSQNLQVPTAMGRMNLSRAIIDAVLRSLSPRQRNGEDWLKLVAGLRLDGFEILGLPDGREDDVFGGYSTKEQTPLELSRMLPDDVPELDFREAENELSRLLTKHGFTVADGHLQQAISTFSRGEWAASNSAVRNLY